MASLITAATYSSGTPQILQFPDNWQAWSHTFSLAEDQALTVEEDGRKIIKAGTFWPANDHTCRGIVLTDVDITTGEGAGALLFAGSVKETKLPEAPSGDAKYALPRVTYFPTVTAPGLGERLDPVEIPAATPILMGGFKVGKHIDMAADGTASIAETDHGQYGVIKIGDTLAVADDGTTDVVPATNAQRGGIRIGDGLAIDDDLASVKAHKGITVDADGVSVDTGNGTQIADDNTLAVKLADDSGLTVDNNGLALSDATKATLKESAPIEHTDSMTGEGTSTSPLGLNPASANLLGGVKIGDHLDITADGTISATTLNAALVKETTDRTNGDNDIHQSLNRRPRGSSITLADGEIYLTLDAHEGTGSDDDKAYVKLGTNLTPITDSITAETQRATAAEEAINTTLATKLDTVAHDTSLTGDGTAATPLGVATAANGGLSIQANDGGVQVNTGTGLAITDNALTVTAVPGTIRHTSQTIGDATEIELAQIGNGGTALENDILVDANGDVYDIVAMQDGKAMLSSKQGSLKGPQGVQGDKGDAGDPFAIAKTYASVDEMNAAIGTDNDVTEGKFVIITTNSVDDADNAKLYVRGADSFTLVTDLSGAQGIKGETGANGKGIYRSTENPRSDALISKSNVDGTPVVGDLILTPNAIIYPIIIVGNDNYKVDIASGVTIKGDKGDKGDAGETGPQGPAGSYTAGTGISLDNDTITVKVGSGLTVGDDGAINADAQTAYTLPTATTDTLGGIKIGDNLTIDADGKLSAPAAYTLPEATTDTLGGVKIGAGLTVQDGKLTTETEARTFANPQTCTKDDNIFQAKNGVYRINGAIPANVPPNTNDTAGAIVWDCGANNKTVLMSDGAYGNALYYGDASNGTWHRLSDDMATTTDRGLMSAADKKKLDGFSVQAFGQSIGRLTDTATIADDATVSAAEYNTLVAAHNALLAEFNRLIGGLESSGYITRPTA